VTHFALELRILGRHDDQDSVQPAYARQRVQRSSDDTSPAHHRILLGPFGTGALARTGRGYQTEQSR
jgi:hypothetical protein